MKRPFFIGLFTLICSCQLYGWNIIHANGGRTNSLGNCSVALSDFWSCHNNPAGFASIKNIGIGVSYQNKFMLKELGYKNAGFLFPIKTGVISISFSQFGYELYNENILGVGFSRNFGTKLRIGLKLDYIFLKYSHEYKDISVPTFELGMQYQINEALCFGAYIFNSINVKLRTINKDKIPIIMRLGFSYYVNHNFIITSELEENFEYNFSYRFGIEYEIYKNIFLRSGFQLNTELFTFGIGYNYKRIVLDVSAQMNQKLGATVNCSFVFIIERKESHRRIIS